MNKSIIIAEIETNKEEVVQLLQQYKQKKTELKELADKIKNFNLEVKVSAPTH